MQKTMDREQEEMQFLTLFGIYKESLKIIFSWRKIFSQITAALILPLAFIFLAHIQVSDVIFMKIIRNERDLNRTRPGTYLYQIISHNLSAEWAYFWLFNAAYFTALLVFSLLSTAAVVYTIASIYTAREVTFKKVIAVVPKVWKRLMITFLCIFLAVFVYNVAAVLVLIAWAMTIGKNNNVGVAVFIVILILYMAGFVYMSVIWQLASVVSVLEEAYGFRAMVKGKALIKGKIWVGIAIFFKLNISLFIVKIVFKMMVVYGWRPAAVRIGYGILCFLLLFKLILFGLVIQTVIYFVCKSYHRENIDKSALSEQLDGYLGEYVPLTKDVQLQQVHV